MSQKFGAQRGYSRLSVGEFRICIILNSIQVYPWNPTNMTSIYLLLFYIMLVFSVNARRHGRPTQQITESPTYSPRPKYTGTVTKDGTLKSLVEILNELIPSHFNFQYDETKSADYVHFIKMIEPWVVASPPHPITTYFRNDYVSDPIDCTKATYSGSLSGKQLDEPRMLIDFIPFGYDVDLLHIRLHENYHAVDAFVIYESPKTQSGLLKSLYFSIVKDSPRFAPYLPKIVHLTSTALDLQPHYESMSRASTSISKVF